MTELLESNRQEAHTMLYEAVESTFVATQEKGEVSSLLIRPPEARWLLVLGHGAGAGMRHRTMETIAHRLAEAGMATFRYQFPYMERGGGGRDSRAVTLATVRAAVAAAHTAAPDLALLAGGHSFSGRMTSTAAAEAPLEHVRGLVFFAFPLHPAGKPGTERADHLRAVSIPMLFLTGTRDKLADLALLKPVCNDLQDRATLHLLDTADHGYKILKRTRQSDEDVFAEMARVVTTWTGSKMETVFFEIHRDLPREAPGSDACTTRALGMIPALPDQPEILDVGCGPGAQTLVLARQTGGRVTAIDTHQPFLDELARRAEKARLTPRITPQNASMFALDFDEAQFDLIWSEGAIYIMGFREGLEAWRRFLKPGGALAVTEATWLTDDPPDELRRFWQAAYPAMQSVEENIAVLEEAGYRHASHFTLPEAAWWDAYYTPIEHRLAALRRTYRDDAEALKILDAEQGEIDLYRRFSAYYGYVFYIMVCI